MADNRKTIKADHSIKVVLEDLKKSLKFSKESEVIGYLYAIYENHYPKITLPEHDKALRRMKDLHNQMSI
ncbi:MAG: hypothetical protein JWM44_3278 [Bacilli bacterium]|jgi:hypothetical protein|nr:hypothetical protein [Bacilli bacterium]